MLNRYGYAIAVCLSLAPIAVLAQTTGPSQPNCGAKFFCPGVYTTQGAGHCYYSIFDPSGQDVFDFQLNSSNGTIIQGIGPGYQYCESRLGKPNEDCLRLPIPDDAFTC